MSVRPYQGDALAQVSDAYRRGLRSVLVQMATGTGKTILFAELCSRASSWRILVLAERRELVAQTAQRMRDWCDEAVGVEMADQRDLTDPGLIGRPRLAVATVQTIAARIKRRRIERNAFDLIVVDEAHHATASTYQDVLNYFEGARVLGVTATPDRADGAALGRVFDDLVYRYQMDAAIRDGWLSPVQIYMVETSVDFSRIKTRAGDYAANDLDRQMRDEKTLAEVAHPIVHATEGRPGMAFTVSVEHAHALARVLCQISGDPDFARGVDGSFSDEQRQEVIRGAQSGRYRWLVNCALLTEGFDWPGVQCIAMARPTKSRALYTQMLGRGTRLAEGKENCLVLDFVGSADQHDLVTAVDIFAESVRDDVREFAYQKAKAESRDGVPLDLEKIMALAAEEAQAAEADVFWRLAPRDPFAAIGLLNDFEGEPALRKAPQPWQLEQLRKLRVPDSMLKGISAWRAQRLIERIRARIQAGLATPKQIALLAKHGLDGRDLGIDEATRVIDAIADAGWKVSDRAREIFDAVAGAPA